MKSDNVTIIPPKGYDTIQDGDVIRFKKKESEKKVKNWNDLIYLNKSVPWESCYIDSYSGINKSCPYNTDNKILFINADRNLFIDKKHAEMSLAISQISQLIPYYGNAITNKEWLDEKIPKYTICRTICRKEDYISFVTSPHYEFLAFHTKEQRDEFFYNNEQLVKNYLMMK